MEYPSHARARRAAHRPFFASLFAGVLALSSCLAYRQAPLGEEALVGELDRRARVADTRAALELLPLEEVSVGVAPRDVARDARDVGFWRARACAWSLGVRAALRDFDRVAELRAAAGLPEGIAIGGEVDDFGDPSRRAVLRASVDVLGVFGLGPRAAAAALAASEVRAALGRLESALWSARFEVERARVRLAATRARIAALEELVASAEDDRVRLGVYTKHDWLPRAPREAARALLANAERLLANERAAEHAAIERLATSCGLATGDASFDAVQPEVLEEYGERVSSPGRADVRGLLERHPLLRSEALAYAVAEARVRRAAAERWPQLRVGPRANLEPSDFLGAFVQLRLPWPGVVDAQTRAALAARSQRRVIVEERVRALRGRIDQGKARLRDAVQAVWRAEVVDDGSRSAFGAAQARWPVDTSKLGTFNDALERRTGACLALPRAREEATIAWLDWREATGPAPRRQSEER